MSDPECCKLIIAIGTPIIALVWFGGLFFFAYDNYKVEKELDKYYKAEKLKDAEKVIEQEREEKWLSEVSK